MSTCNEYSEIIKFIKLNTEDIVFCVLCFEFCKVSSLHDVIEEVMRMVHCFQVYALSRQLME